MIKRILIFTTLALTFFLLGYFTNKYILDTNQLTTRFSLLQVYSFHSIACVLVYISIEIVSNFIPNETGFVYLALLMIKLGLFILIFQDVFFSEIGLQKFEKASILIPFLFFLALETIGVAKLLNNK